MLTIKKWIHYIHYKLRFIAQDLLKIHHKTTTGYKLVNYGNGN